MNRWKVRSIVTRVLRLLRPLDYIVFLVAAGVIVAFSLFSLERGGAESAVEIYADSGRYIYPLDDDRLLTFTGPIGESVVRIHDGSVYFVSSPCRDQICVAAGALSENGQWAACLPNRIFVAVVGDSENTSGSVDATSF